MEPQRNADEVLVKVHAAGICGSDIPRVYTSGTYHYPLIPGHEFSGEVVEAERGSRWLNKRVGIFPLVPCKKCKMCKEKHYELCNNYSYLGSRRDGGFAEYVTVPEWNLIELPNNVSYEAAAMLEPMAVAVHAMRMAMPTAGSTVLVVGLGTIGMMMTMFLLHLRNCKVLVVGNKAYQKSKVMEMGIAGDDYCDSRDDVESWIKERTGGFGVNVVYECVGKGETVAQAISLTAPLGQVVIVGNPHSDITLEKNVYWKILRKEIKLHGTWNSWFDHDENDDWSYVIELLKNRSILPERVISHRYGIDELIQGFEIIRDKKEKYLKILWSSIDGV